jgi:hypothetical protein
VSTSSARTYHDPQGANWLVFAGVLLMMSGILDVIYGVAAVTTSVFFEPKPEFIFGNLSLWGWVNIIIGAAAILATLSIWRGGQLGRFYGILVGTLGALAALLSFGAAPLWSAAVLSVDVLLIYALVRYGGQHVRV